MRKHRASATSWFISPSPRPSAWHEICCSSPALQGIQTCGSTFRPTQRPSGGRHFGEFVDAMRSLRLIGDAVFEYDYFNAGDHRECLDAAGDDDINIHFFNVNAVPGAALPEPGGFPAGISTGRSSSTKLAPTVSGCVGRPCIRPPVGMCSWPTALPKAPSSRTWCGPGEVPSLLRGSYATGQDDVYRVLVVSKYRSARVSGTTRRLRGVRQRRLCEADTEVRQPLHDAPSRRCL